METADLELRYIDLFAGAGGVSVGLEQLSGLPFRSVWANDFNHYATSTYRANFGDTCITGDLVDILQDPETVIPAADLVVGGPPCQGFSLLNKLRADDPRKKLWIPFMEVVDRARAELFVMENVPQLLGSLEHEEILAWARVRGFQVWSGLLLAADYGVPQMRRRAILVGSKRGEPSTFFPPPKTHYNPAKPPDRSAILAGIYTEDAQPWRTVRDAIGALPEPVGVSPRNEPPPLDLHFGRNPTEKSIARYKAIPLEGMNRFDLQKNAPELTPDCWIRKKSGGTDLFGRLWWDRPAFTIRTEFFKPEKGRYLHPEQHRPITHREAARFQTFPDAFTFAGSKSEIARQIGNAVPPRLGAAIAKSIYSLWFSESKEDGSVSRKQASRDHVACQEQEYAAGAAR